jgi:hypothetical protein
MYCRHCTRKRVAGYQESCIDVSQLNAITGYLRAHPEIKDVVISGGDPLTMASSLVGGREGVSIAAQNCHHKPSGAFTGEVAPPMLAKLNVSHVIIGHSERREYFGETDEMVNKKAKAVLVQGMTPIVCCGETLEEREAGGAEASAKARLAFGRWWGRRRHSVRVAGLAGRGFVLQPAQVSGQAGGGIDREDLRQVVGVVGGQRPFQRSLIEIDQRYRDMNERLTNGQLPATGGGQSAFQSFFLYEVAGRRLRQERNAR